MTSVLIECNDGLLPSEQTPCIYHCNLACAYQGSKSGTCQQQNDDERQKLKTGTHTQHMQVDGNESEHVIRRFTHRTEIPDRHRNVALSS